MPRNPLVLLVSVVALVVVVLTVRSYFGGGGGGGGGFAGGAGGGPAMLAGAPAQSYDVKALDGTTSGIDRYRGRVLLVNLWASWCAPCRSETPALERLFDAERARGLTVVGIDQGESHAAAADFAKAMRLTYPILLDEDQRYGRAYAAVGLPTSIVVDRAGRIVRGIDGELSYEQMLAAVAPLLGGK